MIRAAVSLITLAAVGVVIGFAALGTKAVLMPEPPVHLHVVKTHTGCRL